MCRFAAVSLRPLDGVWFYPASCKVNGDVLPGSLDGYPVDDVKKKVGR